MPNALYLVPYISDIKELIQHHPFLSIRVSVYNLPPLKIRHKRKHSGFFSKIPAVVDSTLGSFISNSRLFLQDTTLYP